MIFSETKCKTCNGSGWVRRRSWFEADEVVQDHCDECNGLGKVKSYNIQAGDGRFARLQAADMCVACKTFLDGRIQCPTCKMVYGIHEQETSEG